MSSKIYDNINYSSDISYLTNTFIYEYDISKANINILYMKGVIDKTTYDHLYNSPRMMRQKYIGMLQKDKEVVKILKDGIIEAKKMLFEANNIQDYEVLSVKNDAVFIINRKLKVTEFGLINFVCKNVYTSYYKIGYLELYYYFNNVNNNEYLHVKGISDEKIELHNEYMMSFIKDVFYSVQINGVEIAIRMLKDFYMQYITLALPIGYYRQFNPSSTFHFKFISKMGTGFELDNATEEMKQDIDITYNISILLNLQKILASMYFTKH